jgi:ADP-L-glycero-D-manno-heptose 6-epimerase
MINNNFEYSKELMRQFQDTRIIYASSAAVYGSSTETEEHNDYVPLNIYGYSKLLLDRFVESEFSINVKTGLRFFNVYGPGEQHKGKMSSVIHQLKCGKLTYLFTDGTQKRDFIHVNDVVSIIRHFMRNEVGGTFNVGTGNAISFNEIKETLKLDIPYVDMSETLKSCYQNFTQANVSKLRNIGGYDKNFISIKEGVEMM